MPFGTGGMGFGGAGGAGGAGGFFSGLANFAGGAGGAGGLGGGESGDLSPLLRMLQQLKVSYRGSGGQSFGFEGGGQNRERQMLTRKLMSLLEGPRATGRTGPGVIYVGGQDNQSAETPMGGGMNSPMGTGFSLAQPGGSLAGLFGNRSRLGPF